MGENKSFEQIAEDYQRKIREKRKQILNDFYAAYAASIMEYNKEISLEDICCVEQHYYENGKMITKYWFEYKPEFDDTFRD